MIYCSVLENSICSPGSFCANQKVFFFLKRSLNSLEKDYFLIILCSFLTTTLILRIDITITFHGPFIF